MVPNNQPKYLWLNGEIVLWSEATVHITQIGVASCEEVHEGMRAYWNPEQEQLYLFRPDRHIKRLGNSMKLVGLDPAFSPDDLIDASIRLLRANDARQDFYVRPKAFPRGSSFFVSEGGLTTEVFIHSFPHASRLGSSRAISCCVSSWVRIADNVMPPRVKCASNYRNSLLANREAKRNGYDDAFILNSQGKVAEASVATIFMIRDGVAITPGVTSGILEGITRETVMELLDEVFDMPVVERDVDRTELYIADEVFYCGTGREITAVTSVDRFPVGTGDIGPVTKRIEMLYHDIVRGKNPEYLEWCFPVYA